MNVLNKIIFFSLFPFLCLSQTQIGNDIDGGNSFEEFGTSVSISSDGSVVAGSGVLNDGTNFVAFARVFRNISGSWVQVGNDIHGSLPNNTRDFKVSLSSDGNVIAIGASGFDTNYSLPGYVRVFRNISGTWTQIGVDIIGEGLNDRFGYSVSLSSDGNTLAIGAPYNDGNGENSGHVRVYQNILDTWVQVGADIDGDDIFGDNSDYSGRCISLSSNGSIVAIGALGKVKVYQNVSGTWIQVGTNINGSAQEFGQSVSLSSDGNTLAISKLYTAWYDPGHVIVYRNVSNVWTQVGNIMYASNNSGHSVSLSSDGNILASGAMHGFNGHGQARIYRNFSDNWMQVGADINGEAFNDNFGCSISLSSSGNVVAVGGRGNDGTSTQQGVSQGHIRVYDLTASNLTNDDFIQNTLTVYPNPSSNKVTIQLNEGLQMEKVEIYNTLGQLLKTEYKTEFTVSDLLKGAYVLKVTTNEGRISKKIVVE